MRVGGAFVAVKAVDQLVAQKLTFAVGDVVNSNQRQQVFGAKIVVMAERAVDRENPQAETRSVAKTSKARIFAIPLPR